MNTKTIHYQHKKNISPPVIEENGGIQKIQLPASWLQVIGILKGRRKDIEVHIKKMRSEWG